MQRRAFCNSMLRTRLLRWTPHMPGLLDGREAVWFPFATHKGLETQVDGWLNALRARVRFGALCPASSATCAPCSMKCAW